MFGPFGILQPGGLNDAGDFDFGFTLAVPFNEFGSKVWPLEFPRRIDGVPEALVNRD